MSKNTEIIEYFNSQMVKCKKYDEQKNKKGKVRTIKGETVEQLTKMIQ